MRSLGWVLLWQIGDGNLHVPLAGLADIPGIELPDRPIPIDVYRRVTGSSSVLRTRLEDGELEVRTANAESPSDKMLIRHLIATVAERGVAKRVERVGDAAFYKPPRGKNSKARMRVTVTTTDPLIKQQVEAYANELRTRYSEGVTGHLDAQAVRRLVRRHLARIGALYLGGPYFVLDRDGCEALRPLFDDLGEAGMLHLFPLPDTPEERAFLVQVMERAVRAGNDVDPAIWSRLEEEA